MAGRRGPRCACYFLVAVLQKVASLDRPLSSACRREGVEALGFERSSYGVRSLKGPACRLTKAQASITAIVGQNEVSVRLLMFRETTRRASLASCSCCAAGFRGRVAAGTGCGSGMTCWRRLPATGKNKASGTHSRRSSRARTAHPATGRHRPRRRLSTPPSTITSKDELGYPLDQGDRNT